MITQKLEIARCTECGKTYEIPTLYRIDNPDKIDETKGYCFLHNRDKEERNKALSTRVELLKQRYHTPYSDVAKFELLKRSKLLASFGLEESLAKFAFEKLRERAPYVVIAAVDAKYGITSKETAISAKIKNDNLGAYFAWRDIKKDFPETYFSTSLGKESRLVIITDTKELITFAKKVKGTIEQKRSDLLIYAGCSHFDCNKKRTENIADLIEQQFAESLRKQMEMPEQIRFKNVSSG